MADDYTQRPPYRPSEPPARGQPAKALGSGSDPLAELARLIGQNDPFSEYGRDGVRRPAPPQPPEPAPEWDAGAPVPGYEPQALPPQTHQPTPGYPRQSFGSAPLGSGLDLYQVENEVPGYPSPHAPPNYEDVPYNQNNAHLDGEDDGFYEDEQPSRRRITVLAIAGIFALAVIGTAGAFGYRALFGSSSTSGPPPVIKADSAPSKIVPASVKDATSNKQITDRVNEKGIGEKLVSREEQPVAAQPQDTGPNANNQPLSGSGVVGSEPKKVRTIAIRPDGSPSTDSAAPVQSPAAPQPPSRVVNVTPAKPAAQTPPPRVNNPPEEAADPGPRPSTARVAPPARQPVAEAPATNAPLSLSPDAAPSRQAPARSVAPAARVAAVAPAAQVTAAAASSGSYAVQVSSQRSEAEAQAAFRTLQGKYPGQLGGKQSVIRQVDLGDKGVYYRALVPAGSSSAASELCSSLKAAGASCVIQRN